MIFTVECGFTPELGYDPVVLNRTNARFQQFIGPFEREIVGSRVLDLASHDGRWTFAALKLGANHVTGIEARLELIDRGKHIFANPKFNGRYDFLQGDIFDVMPELLKKKSGFDVVFCLGIFYHVMDHFRLLRLIRDFCPRLVVLDTGLIDDEKPYISLTTERNDSVVNAIPISDAEKQSVVGIVSKGGLIVMCKALGFSVNFLSWSPENFRNRAGLTDYFEQGRDKRRRFSVILRTV
jgi:hypothetical protein